MKDYAFLLYILTMIKTHGRMPTLASSLYDGACHQLEGDGLIRRCPEIKGEPGETYWVAIEPKGQQ